MFCFLQYFCTVGAVTGRASDLENTCAEGSLPAQVKEEGQWGNWVIQVHLQMAAATEAMVMAVAVFLVLDPWLILSQPLGGQLLSDRQLLLTRMRLTSHPNGLDSLAKRKSKPAEFNVTCIRSFRR